MRNHRSLQLSFLFILIISSIGEASPFVGKKLSDELSSVLPIKTLWELVTVDLTTKKEIRSLGNTSQPLLPGSLVKLLISGAALEQQANNIPLKMNTDILYDGEIEGGTVNGNIYLRGNGNCFLSVDDLRNVALALRSKGIVKITGGIVSDDSHFNTMDLGRTRRGAGYSPAGALGLDLHTVSIKVIPSIPGAQPTIRIDPPNDSVRFAVDARTVAGKTNILNVLQADDDAYLVSGDISSETGPVSWRFNLARPARYAAGCFKTILHQEGVEVSKGISEGSAPDKAVILETIPGLDLNQFVKLMNTNSLNVAGDNLLLSLSSTSEEIGTRIKGIKIVENHLARLGIPAADVQVVDGSGLLDGNRITAHAMADYLTSASTQKWFQGMYQSLPRAGLDGTLKSSYRNAQFRAKTGSLESVFALAGYGVDRSGREIVFAFIVNSLNSLPPTARNTGDIVMHFLAEEVMQ